MNIRIIVSMGLLFLPGACAMSSGMVALTYAATGVSYVSSGKGIADHALSASADKDCSMHRAIEGKDICEREDRGQHGTLMTMIDTSPVSSSVSSSVSSPVALRYPATDDAKPASDLLKIGADGSAGHPIAKENGSAASALESIYSLDR